VTESTAPQTSRPICPWCSAELRTGTEAICPSCGATLVGEGPTEAAVPGVTAIDAEAIVRGARSPVPERRSRLLGWITGEEAGEPETPAAPGSLEPPPPEVRREMLRMELEAEVAELQAEVGALAAEARDAGLDEEEQALEAVADDAAELKEDVAAGDEDVAPTAGAGSGEDRPPA
jgi:hypothetical protein